MWARDSLLDRFRIGLVAVAANGATNSRDQVKAEGGFSDMKGCGHWSEAGHQLAGQLIANKLLEMLCEQAGT
jgi:hypothetical protein